MHAKMHPWLVLLASAQKRMRVIHVRVSIVSESLAYAENSCAQDAMKFEKQPLARHVSSDCFCTVYHVLLRTVC